VRADEQKETFYGRECIVLKSRYGFVKLAMARIYVDRLHVYI